MKSVVYCVLTFVQSTTSLISLCMSSYQMAYSINQPWMWDHIVVVSCIATTIFCGALRQSIDKLFLENYIVQGDKASWTSNVVAPPCLGGVEHRPPPPHHCVHHHHPPPPPAVYENENDVITTLGEVSV